MPTDADAAKASLDALGRPTGAAADIAERIKAEAGEEADALYAQHTALLPPECHRAPTHLQMAALALGAQRTLLREGAKEEYGWAGEDVLKARSVVAGAHAFPNPRCAPHDDNACSRASLSTVPQVRSASSPQPMEAHPTARR